MRLMPMQRRAWPHVGHAVNLLVRREGERMALVIFGQPGYFFYNFWWTGPTDGSNGRDA